MSNKEIIKPLIENYNQICWCHDLEIVAKTKKWTSRTAKSVSNKNSIIPDLTNFENFAYMRTNAGAKATYFEHGNNASVAMRIHFTFNTDVGKIYTGTNYPYNGSYNYVVPMICLCVDSDGAIDTNAALRQYVTMGYNLFHFGILGQDTPSLHANLESLSSRKVSPLTNIPDNAYFGLKFTSTGAAMDTTVYWDSDNTEAFALEDAPYNASEPTTSTSTLESSKLTFPLSSYFAPSEEQANADLARIANMMLGKKTTLKMPVLWNVRSGGRTGTVGFPHQESSGTGVDNDVLFPDWSKWNSYVMSATLKLSPMVSTGDMGGVGANNKSWTLSSSSVNLSLPISKFFDVSSLKSGVAKYQNESLNICGGIPILIDASFAGDLIINLKCSKYYTDITAGTITNDNITGKIKIKNSPDANGINDYYVGEIDGALINIDGSTISNLSDITITIPNVQKGANAYLNIDPGQIGEYIKINDMSITLSRNG